MAERTPDPRLKATEYFRQAYERQMSGDFDEAIQLYTRSIEIFPTVEAYTCRGAWRPTRSILSSATLTTTLAPT